MGIDTYPPSFPKCREPIRKYEKDIYDLEERISKLELRIEILEHRDRVRREGG